MTDKKIPKELINNWFKDKMNFSLNNEQLNDLCLKIDNYAKINFVRCCETLPSKGFISQVAEKRALKFNYVNEIGYLRHKKSFELGAEFVKEHLEKQK